MEQEKKYAVCQASVWGLCQEYQRRGEVPQITVIRDQFDKPHSLHIQRHWSEWMRHNREWVASKKGAKYGYKRLYQESLEQVDKLNDSVEATLSKLASVTEWLEEYHPGVFEGLVSSGRFTRS